MNFAQVMKMSAKSKKVYVFLKTTRNALIQMEVIGVTVKKVITN